MSGRLVERFVRLCEIPSPTGDERAVADAVATELRSLGLELREDDAQGPARAGSGNLVARIPGQGEEWLALFSHLDTVPHDGAIEVVEEGGVLRSSGETILGADNKAAVAVCLELAQRLTESGRAPALGVELVFTVAEEDGLRGARHLDLGGLEASSGLVLDHASPIGEVITRAPTHNRVTATFRGVESHAGIRPEAGRSALQAAARAILAAPQGRLDEETTANVGVVRGGTATNVIPGWCTVEAEARSLDHERAQEATRQIVQAATDAAGGEGIDVDVCIEEMFRGYSVEGGSRALELARRGLERSGVEPLEVSTGGGSDANALAERGFDCVLLANGTHENHTPSERVAVAELERMLSVLEATVGEPTEGVGD